MRNKNKLTRLGELILIILSVSYFFFSYFRKCSLFADVAVPFLFVEVLFDLKSGGAEGSGDIRFPAVDDAGGYEHGALRHKRAHERCKRDYDIGDDVCKHDIVARAEASPQGGVTDDIAGVDL